MVFGITGCFFLLDIALKNFWTLHYKKLETGKGACLNTNIFSQYRGQTCDFLICPPMLGFFEQTMTRGTVCSAYNVIDICDPRCDIGFISFLCYWFYIHGIVIHLLVTLVVPVILIVIVANLLFSRFQVHGIVPAWLSMFPILLMSSIATLFWRWAQKKERERTIVRKGETIIVLSFT